MGVDQVAAQPGRVSSVVSLASSWTVLSGGRMAVLVRYCGVEPRPTAPIRFIVGIDRFRGNPRLVGAVVVGLLAIHAGSLAYSATRHSPTIDEPAHLAAGLNHWSFGRFDLYRVNPPRVRLLASAPVFLLDPKTDWSRFTNAPCLRSEFSVGTDFVNANGADVFWYVTVARWACIPLSLAGGYVCYRWSRDLYGATAGILALALWCSSPNILGNGAVTTLCARAVLTVTAFVKCSRRTTLAIRFGCTRFGRTT
jgi:hypothetical protein